MLKNIQQWGIVVIILSASLQCKAVPLNAYSLINQVTSAYNSLHSYKIMATYKLQIPNSGKIIIENSSSFAFDAPDKMMIRDDKGIYACNGAVEKTFVVSYNQYVMHKAPSNFKELHIN